MNNESSETTSRFDPVPVDLKNRGLAAMLAWLWPGAGHLYQGRYGKAVLFMVCILVTYFWGLAMGDGHVVYASFRNQDMRYEYLLQMHVGLPAMPALAQNFLAEGGNSPLGEFMAPPEMIRGENHESVHDQKAEWHGKLGFFFELGTLFTMVAGLLNLLAVFDAFSGPGFTLPESETRRLQSDQSHQSGFAFSLRESVGGALETGALVLGIVAAMTIKYRLELDNRWLSYVCAIGGGFAGFYLARGLNRVIGGAFDSMFGVSETAATDAAFEESESTSA